VCGGHEMRHGRHYATFTLRTLGQYGSAFLGVVGAGFDPAADCVAACLDPQGWALSTAIGHLCHAARASTWEGQPEEEDELKEGDVVVRPLPPPLFPVTPQPTA